MCNKMYFIRTSRISSTLGTFFLVISNQSHVVGSLSLSLFYRKLHTGKMHTSLVHNLVSSDKNICHINITIDIKSSITLEKSSVPPSICPLLSEVTSILISMTIDKICLFLYNMVDTILCTTSFIQVMLEIHPHGCL